MNDGWYVPLALLTALVVAAPAMGALGTLEVRADLPLVIDGDRTATTPDGALLVEGTGGFVQAGITAADGDLYRVVHRSFFYRVNDDPDARLTIGERAERTRISLEGSQATLTQRLDDFKLLAFDAGLSVHRGPGGEPLLVGALTKDVTIRSDVEYTVQAKLLDNQPVPFRYTLDAGTYQARLSSGSTTASGAFDLFMFGAIVDITTPRERLVFEASEREEQRSGTIYDPLSGEWIGGGSHTELIHEYFQFDVRRGDLAINHAAVPATLHGAWLSTTANGVARIPQAQGTLTIQEEDSTTVHQLDGEELELRGKFTLVPYGLDHGMTSTGLDGDGDFTYVSYGPQVHSYDWATALKAVGLGALILAVGVWLWGQSKAVLGAGGLAVAGYARVQGRAVLEHPGRQQVYDAVRAHPGISMVELAELVGFGGSTLNYHLRVLERNELLISIKDGRYVRFFDQQSGLYANGRKQVVAALRNKTTSAIAKHIVEHPGVPQCDVAQEFGIAASTVNWHVKRLTDAGLVEKRRDRHFTRYFLGEAWSRLPPEEAARHGLGV